MWSRLSCLLIRWEGAVLSDYVLHRGESDRVGNGKYVSQDSAMELESPSTLFASLWLIGQASFALGELRVS